MPTDPSPEQKAAALFDLLAPDYDSTGVPFFGPIAHDLIEAMALQPGEDVLDMGCGRGAVLIPAATIVAPGRAVGMDISPAMIEIARSAVRESGLTNAEATVGSAITPDLPASSFDAVLSSLVLFFLPDPLTALSAWLPLLRPGGRVGVTTFGATDPRWKDIDEVLAPFMPSRDARTSGTQGPFESDAGMEELLSRAGFEKVRTVRQELDVSFTSPEDWQSFSMSLAQRAGWMRVPEDQRASVREEAFRRYRSHADADGRAVFTQAVRHSLGVRHDE
jgi:ubiquinone/menaquinone biosynthesis C-methylase UbiE